MSISLHRSIRTIGSALLALGGIAASHAQSTEVPQVIVTATRTAQTADQSLAAVTVITREDIERSGADTIADVLRGRPGISLTNNGGVGKATSVLLRGTESDHVAVLIDGVKVGSATLGTTAFQNIPIEQVERIEVVRGPRSSLYGSEAIGGVIQIFTRRGGGELRPFASAGLGSHRSHRTAAGVSGGAGDGWFSLAASEYRTAGIDSCRGSFTGGCFTFEPDKDGYREVSASAAGGYRFGDRLEVDGNYLRSDGSSQYDGGFQNADETLQEVLGGRVRITPVDAWTATLSAGRARDESRNFLNGAFSSRFDTTRSTVGLQNDVLLGDSHLLTVGIDYLHDEVEGSVVYAESSRDNVGVFGQYQGNLAGNDLLFGLRADDNEQFGGATTANAGWGRDIAGFRFTAAAGTAFKTPNFNELYFPGFGNPMLSPEESSSYEVGMARSTAIGRVAVNAFRTNVDDLIGFDPTFAPVNIDRARIRGVELEVDTEVAGIDVGAAFTLLRTENRSIGPNFGNELPRRPQQTLRLDLDRRFGDLTLGTTLLAASDRYDDLANTRRLGGYGTIDLRVAYEFARDWQIQANINNLLDKDYETASFFNQDGRNVFITLRYQPGAN